MATTRVSKGKGDGLRCDDSLGKLDCCTHTVSFARSVLYRGVSVCDHLKTITANGTSVRPDTGGYTPVHPDTVCYVRSSSCEYNNPTCPTSHHILVHLLSLSTLWWLPLALMPRYVKMYVMPTTATSTPVHLELRYIPIRDATPWYMLIQ